jgi:hypothetical protein
MTPDSNWLSRALKRAQPPIEDDLHCCIACGKDYVNPVEWEPVTPEAWWIQLRCGECHMWREVTVTNQVAEQFDLELDRRPLQGMDCLQLLRKVAASHTYNPCLFNI